MSEYLMLYLWSISEGVSDIFVFIATVAGVVFVVTYCASRSNYFDNDISEKDKKECFNVARNCMVFFIISLFLAVMIPSKSDIALIYIAPKIIHNQKITAIPNKTLDLVNQYLENFLKEAQLKNKELLEQNNGK